MSKPEPVKTGRPALIEKRSSTNTATQDGVIVSRIVAEQICAHDWLQFLQGNQPFHSMHLQSGLERDPRSNSRQAKRLAELERLLVEHEKSDVDHCNQHVPWPDLQS